MTDSISIVKAEPKDIDLICELVSALLTGFNEVSGANFDTDLTHLKVVTTKLLSRHNYGVFIAYTADGVPVGLISIAEAFAIYNGGDFGVITELFVHKGYRSKGIGKLLLAAAIDFSKAMNWNKIEVGAPNQKDWARTISFYEANNFVKGGPKLRVNLT